MTVQSDPPSLSSRDGRPTVAVWRTVWLPASETFILNQVQAMHRWRPLRLAVGTSPSPLGPPPDLAPFAGHIPVRYTLSAAGLAVAIFGRNYDRALQQSGARLVHAHFGTDAVSALPLARRNALPLLVTFHGYDITSRLLPTRAGERYRRKLSEVFDYATRLIAVSDFIAGRLAELGAPEQKIRIHRIGIPAEAAPVAGEVSRSGITFVGRLVEKKGVEDLFDAVAALPEPLRRATPVRIIGGGHLRESLGALSRRHDIDVEFLGPKSPSEVAAALSRSAIFCGPSKTAPDGDAEGFGMVFLEAARAGLPVAAYRHGGVPEAVLDGVTGLLADEGDVQGLSDRLETLLTDPGLAQRMGNAGRLRVIREFDINRQTALLEDMYDEVAQR